MRLTALQWSHEREKDVNKAEKIKSALQETKERRKGQRPVVFQLKLQNLSKKKEEDLRRAFLEAKWLYNWLVSDTQRLDLPANKVREVKVKVGEVFEERELVILGSQVKQEIADRLKDNLRALSQLKRKGHKVGGLKPKRFVNSIPLKQHGVTFALDWGRNRVRIQKLGSFRVLGLHQIPPDGEIGNALLVRKPSGYYLHVTCYLPKESASREPIGEAIAIDFGVYAKLTLSNGIKIDFELRETERLKTLQRKLVRAKKGSKNKEKLRLLLRREYERIARRRRDIHNKVLAFLRGYRKVVFQEDFVKGWTRLFGGQVHSSGVGGLKARLRDSLATPVPVDRFEPTTKECFACGRLHELSLGDRVLWCECGWVCDRDHNAALVILRKGLGLSPDQAVGLDRPELKPLEREAIMRILGSNPYIRISFPEGGSPPL
jgi:putative transposase